jgi:hypothetical protein
LLWPDISDQLGPPRPQPGLFNRAGPMSH